MNFHTLLHTLLISSLSLKISSIDAKISVSKCNCDCDCLHISECKYYEEILEKTNGAAQITYCNRFNELVCCRRDEQTTISEKKCMEFAEIKGFCPTRGLIKDGKVTNPHEIPFMASVQVKRTGEKDYKWICGGALIDPNFVVTAAHCFDDFDTNVVEVYVLLGAHYRNSTDKRLRVNITIHPEYGNSPNSFADIALLKLHSNANITTEKIRPVCLPKTNDSELETFMTAGWGYNRSQNEPDQLLKTTLVQKPIENCPDPKGSDINSLICATPNGSSGDVCQGDSGGPLFAGYPDRDNCLFAIMAVVSQGLLCDAPLSHTLHTRISYFREWIERTVWPEETTAKYP